MLKNAFYIALFALISWGSYQLSFPSSTPPDLFYEGIFMENIIEHVDELTQGKRAVGDYYHDDVRRYLTNQLKGMGWQVSIQKSTAFNPKNRSAAPIRNIIATKNGSNPKAKSLVVMAHYDSAKFSATGAGDDASGVAVILETLSAFIKTKQTHSNDIIVLFTDAEEIGLLGAHAFINEQLSNHNMGLIINLEARGSSGPVMMWPETTGGNRAMIEAFSAANVPMPVTTSLHYEIYKKLPNDTDLTPFSQQGKINGFNLAFIDDHFNYHTQLDSLWNLSLNTLAHQFIQLNSMIKYFSNADLSQMHADDSLVYFSVPILGLISYPVWLNWLLLVVFGVIFLRQLFNLGSRLPTKLKNWALAMVPIVLASGLAYGWCWLMLWAVYQLFPEYQDIMQGFPYQGHAMMAALLIGAGVIVTSVIGWFNKKHSSHQDHQNAINILLWLLLLIPLMYFMPGSGLLIWPVLFAVVLLAIRMITPRLAEQLAPVFAALSFILMGTLLINFPIALGVDAIPLTAVILVWLMALFVPVISPLKKIYHGLFLLLIPTGFLAFALFQNPSISAKFPHPTSLSYLYDSDSQQGQFFNYDVIQSDWNEHLFEHAHNKQALNDFWNQYKKPVRHMSAVTPAIPLKTIDIKASQPLKQGPNESFDVTITANNDTEILEIFTQQDITIHKFSIEGRNAVLSEPLNLRSGQRLLHYYFNGKKQIQLNIEMSAGDDLDWQVQSHGLDLLSRPEFNIEPRPTHQIPKPFIKSDNTIVVQLFTFGLNQQGS